MLKTSLLVLFSLLILHFANALEDNIRSLEILEEENNKFTIREVLSGHLEFKPYRPSRFLPKNTSYWLKFSYEKRNIQDKEYLFSPFLLYKKFDLYYQEGDSLLHFESGLSQKLNNRNVYAPNLYLELPNHSLPTVCYLHITGFFDKSFFVAVKNSNWIIKEELQNAVIEFLFIGLSLLAFIFSLIFFAYLKDRLYLYYASFSIMLVLSRLTFNGFIFNFFPSSYNFESLKSVFNIYSLTYAGIHIASLLYFHEFLKFYHRSKRYYYLIYFLIVLRILFLSITLSFDNYFVNTVINSDFVDVAIQLFLLFIALKTSKVYRKPVLLCVVSIVLLLIGNLVSITGVLELFGVQSLGYGLFLNIAGIEVIVFAIGIAYRNNFLKRERDESQSELIRNLKASEVLKDNINKELERQVAVRTKKIEEMNALLKSYNMELKTEVKVANEARVFQRNMSYNEFKKIFPDDESCFKYLAKLKWKSTPIKCKRCQYDKQSVLENYTIRCGKCGNIESVTNGTLYHKLKFSILKAFYLTYLTTTTTKLSTTTSTLSEELEIRPGTLLNFRKKVLTLIESYKVGKKHKDGWTHIIDYSMSQYGDPNKNGGVGQE